MGPVESILQKNIEKQGCIHLALFDPEKSAKNLKTACMALEKLGTTAIMVGGSTVTSTQELDETIRTIKDSCTLPAILFPNGLSGLSRFADAIFFMSLLNSSQTHYITGAQALGAPVVKRLKLETIPLGYILVGESETAVSSISRAGVGDSPHRWRRNQNSSTGSSVGRRRRFSDSHGNSSRTERNWPDR